MKTTIFRSSWLMMVIAGALVAPAQLSAQGADSARTHVVRRGDTLWDLAATYLGDGARWREILAVNASIRGAVALPVGATLRIPGKAASKPQAAEPIRPVAPPRSAPAPTSAPQRPPPRDTSRTIFFGVRPGGGFAPRDSIAPVAAPVPASAFEAVSAPFVIDAGEMDRSGRCVSIGATAAPDAGGVLLHGTLSIQLPGGAAAEADSRWLLVRRGPVLTGLGAVVFPTAIVRLTSAAAQGQPARAEVVAQFDAMSCSDAVLPSIAMPALPAGRLTPVSDGVRGRVAWVASESMLPTLQHALILDIGAAAGVRLGDRVTIYGGRGGTIVGIAEVVRVDARSATALVVRQSLGSLAAGLTVRVTEKLP